MNRLNKLVCIGDKLLKDNDKLFRLSPYASGGIITYIGYDVIHTFNSSDNFIVYHTIDASVLIVGGGGDGGSCSGS